MLTGQQIGPFAIEKILGNGAMGTVYRAVHLELKLRVALKVMAPGLSSEVALKRFKREAEILKRLKHPNIVRLIGIGKHHKSPYYAMEYIEGESLDQVITRRGRISWEELVEMGSQLCAGLQHAHQNSVIHRDLKPSNVMVLADGTVKLTDFGIAKDTSFDATQYTAANCTVGTASYMSPEQCRGERDLTAKSDLYSLGIMFYELVTGRKPFLAETVIDMFKAHESQPAPRATRLVPDIPVELDRLIYHLLEKTPDKRPLDAAAVGEALTRIKEKMEAMQSAGMTRLKSRKADISELEPELDETDKEIGRTLLNKKKKKKKKAPFYTKGWFVAAAILAVLIGSGFIFYQVFIKPPSAESLLFEARKLMQTGEEDRRLEARRGPIADFLGYYPDHKEAAQMRATADEIDLARLERQMHNRREKFSPSGDAEKWFRKALDREDDGNLAEAADLWGKLAEYKNPQDEDERAWRMLGEKNRKELDAVDTLYQELQGKVKKEKAKEKTAKPDAKVPDKKASPKKTGPTDGQLALLAVSAEATKGDAKMYWEDLQKQTKDDPTRRRWYLLAAKRLRELRFGEKASP